VSDQTEHANVLLLTDSEAYQAEGQRAAEESIPIRERTEMPDIRASVGTLLEWVGSDAERAQQVLDRENSADKPRSTLVEALEPVADAG